MVEKENKLYYFAHPYSDNPHKNYRKCLIRTNKLMDMGYNVFSPIVYSHFLHQNRSRTYEGWLKIDEIFMARCDGIILVENEWQNSKGCIKEKEYMESKNKEIIYFDFSLIDIDLCF